MAERRAMATLRSIFGKRKGQQGGGAPHVRYTVHCRCGEVLTGQRTPHFQAVTCASCGLPNFVLPLNPRAMPAGATRRDDVAPPNGQPAAETVEPGEFVAAAVVDRLEGKGPVPDAEVPRAEIPEAELPEQVVTAGNGASEAVTAEPHRERTAEERRSEARRAARRRRRLRARLVALAIVLLIAVTLFATWRSTVRARYARDLEHDTTAGYDALLAADFVAAESMLRRADRAAVGLGDDTPAARRAVQLHHEARLWASLLARPVDDLLAVLADAGQAGKQDDKWRRMFQDAFRGRSLVISGQMRAAGDDDPLPPAPAEQEPDVPPATARYVTDWSLVGDGAEIRLDLGELALP
ncbi:MAG: hypothetical protein KDA63_06965, partial [Planctomycetales bacterium]|nr:hypothetical protein [Planctomycetales bacterium]